MKSVLFVTVLICIVVLFVAAAASIVTPRIVDMEGRTLLESQPLLTAIGIRLQPLIPNTLLTWFTTDVCRSRGESKDPQVRLDFAREYGVRWQEARLCKDAGSLEECVGRFETLNDFFVRQIHPELTSVGAEDLTSPAECRMRIVSPDVGAFQIKGIHYSVAHLLGPAASWLPTPASIALFRLAPTDYHRIHAPVESSIVRVEDIVGTHQSVDVSVQGTRPVLRENVRRVVCLQHQGTRLALILVGATCVGSIRTSVTVGDRLQKGQDMGDFAFGGSCVVLLCEKPIRWNARILQHSIAGYETFVRAGTGIGSFVDSAKSSQPSYTEAE